MPGTETPNPMHRIKSPKKLIEVALPLDDINAAAQDAGQRHEQLDLI